MQSDFHLLDADYCGRLAEAHPEVYKLFMDWLNKYKLQMRWPNFIKANVDFFDLPSDMQHGILSRFFFEAGDIGDRFMEAQKNWVKHTEFMFDQLDARIKNKYNE